MDVAADWARPLFLERYRVSERYRAAVFIDVAINPFDAVRSCRNNGREIRSSAWGQWRSQRVGSIWAGEPTLTAHRVGFDGLTGVVDGRACPPIMVGASAWSTIEVAVELADGVNIRSNTRTGEYLDRLSTVRPAGFEVSVLDWLANPDSDVKMLAKRCWRKDVGEEVLAKAGCDRLILGTSSPFDLDAILVELRTASS